MQKAVEVFQLAENAFGERMAAAGNLFDPALGVEAGLMAALPYLKSTGDQEAQPADSGRAGEDAAEKARHLTEIVRNQCGGYLSGPGFDALTAARELDAALAAQGQPASAAGVPGGCIPVPRSLVERWAKVDAFNAPIGAAMELKVIAGQMLQHADMLAAAASTQESQPNG